MCQQPPLQPLPASQTTWRRSSPRCRLAHQALSDGVEKLAEGSPPHWCGPSRRCRMPSRLTTSAMPRLDREGSMRIP
jgi:hypothetical protein